MTWKIENFVKIIWFQNIDNESLRNNFTFISWNNTFEWVENWKMLTKDVDDIPVEDMQESINIKALGVRRHITSFSH